MCLTMALVRLANGIVLTLFRSSLKRSKFLLVKKQKGR
jgi:hypothetical protein